MSREIGDVIRINARGRVRDVNPDTGSYTIELEDIKDETKAEVIKIEDKEGNLADEDLALLFGEDA
jgi:hypothetical protein